MAVIFSDNFNRSDSSDLGSNWTEDTGDAKIQGNEIETNTTGANTIATATGGTPSGADYSVQAVVNTNSTAHCGVVARFANTTNMYLLRMRHWWGGGALELLVLDSVGGDDTLGSHVPGGDIGGTDYTIKLEVTGTTIKGYLNGTERISVTNSVHTATGEAGIFLRNNNPGDNKIDDFQIEADAVNTEPTVALNSPADEATTSDTTPTLEFTGTDDEADDITYQIQIADEDTFTTPIIDALSASDPGFVNTEDGGDSDAFTSGEKISYTVQAGDELDPDTYYWRVRGKDPDGTDTFGDWSATREFTIPVPDPTLTQHSYRWRDDDGDETDATWAANLNTSINLIRNQTTRLRILLDSAGNYDPAQLQLEYRIKDSEDAWEAVL